MNKQRGDADEGEREREKEESAGDLDDADDHDAAAEEQDAQDVLGEGGHQGELQAEEVVVRSGALQKHGNHRLTAC